MIDALMEAEVVLKSYFDERHQALQSVILGMFAAINSIRIVAYVPQIVKAARDGNGASAISYTTWSLFLISHITTILYAVVCLADLVMAAIFLGNALACLAIILIASRNRRRFNLRIPR